MLGGRPVGLAGVDVQEAQEERGAGMGVMVVDRGFRRRRIEDAQQMGGAEFRDDGGDAVQPTDLDRETRGHSEARSLVNGAFAPFVRPTPQSDPWRHDRARIVS